MFLSLSRTLVTSHLMFSNRAIFSTAPRLWNDLPPELRTISLHQSSTTVIANHKTSFSSIHHPQAFHSKLKCHLFKHSYPDPSDHSPSPSERHPPYQLLCPLLVRL